MGCAPSANRSSTSSSPEPDNNNRFKQFEPNLLPDPKCGIRIRLSPTNSQVDEDGAGRPAKVEVQDAAEVGHALVEDDGLGPPIMPEESPGHGMLGLLTSSSPPGIKKGDAPFNDPDFPADNKALFFSERSPEEISQYSWKRPHELVAEPEIFVDGTSRRDVLQGILGDCWLLSTCAALAKREDLLQRVIDPQQKLFGPGYTGVIRINIWRYGSWTPVYIDDRLPQKNGKYCFAHCQDPREFWVALIEKAYAKLHGSYEAVEGGMPIEAMVDLTGGLAERYELNNHKQVKQLYKYLRKSFASQAFITCSRQGDWRRAHRAEKNGLVEGHAYTITGLYRVNTNNSGRVALVRIRNPWGDQNEWMGAWSDGDKQWDHVDTKVKSDMGLQYMKDGEFWIDFFTDFCREFEEVSICNLGPDFDLDGKVDNHNAIKLIYGEWIPGRTAGGCRNDLQLFAKNPQYLLTLHQGDQDNDEVQNPADPKCQIIISLLQEHRRSDRNRKVRMLQIGFCIYRALESNSRLPSSYFLYNYDVGNSGPYINYREVFARFELSVGSYVIIPATFEPNISSRFMMRIYTEKPMDLVELTS